MYGVLQTETKVYTFLTPSEQLFKYKCPGGEVISWAKAPALYVTMSQVEVEEVHF
jgi:hypothetical protein